MRRGARILPQRSWGGGGDAQPFQGRARTRHGAAWNENKVMHASFRVGETVLMASDGRCDGQPAFEGFSLSIIVPDEEKAESVFNALADGGKVTMPLEKTFWAPKFGMLEDRFGVGWMVSVQHKT